MIFTEMNNILFANHRFSAGKQIYIGSEFGSLLYDIIHFFIGQIQLIAIFSRPAAGTFQIAGTCRIHKNCPWYIAIIFFFILTLFLVADQGTIDNKVLQQPVSDTRINVLPEAHDQLIPVIVPVPDHASDCITLSA